MAYTVVVTQSMQFIHTPSSQHQHTTTNHDHGGPIWEHSHQLCHLGAWLHIWGQAGTIWSSRRLVGYVGLLGSFSGSIWRRGPCHASAISLIFDLRPNCSQYSQTMRAIKNKR